MNNTPTSEAIIYARFSPRPGKTMTIDAQVAACREHAEKMGWNSVADYTDNETSGKTNSHRPGLAAAILDASRRQCPLIAYSLSRFARSLRDTLQHLRTLEEAGASLITIKESWDTRNCYGRFSLHILAAVAELEREMTAERTSEMMRYYQTQGYRMSSRCPYGWEPDLEGPTNDKGNPSKMKPNKIERRAIELMKELAGEGKSHRAIARLLPTHGFHSRSGDWDHRTIRRILAREATTQ